MQRKKAETSPHTRGELSPSVDLLETGRNIPAYAGRTRRFLFAYMGCEKHPRIRGENSNILNH